MMISADKFSAVLCFLKLISQNSVRTQMNLAKSSVAAFLPLAMHLQNGELSLCSAVTAQCVMREGLQNKL